MKKNKIQAIVQVMETGSVKPRYDYLVVMDDGPNEIAQITYGKLQTTEYGNLAKLVGVYMSKEGLYDAELEPFLHCIGKMPLSSNEQFKSVLRKAGKMDPAMWSAQDDFFDDVYWSPAKKWFDLNGFKEELSMLIIFDSFIHSGGILSLLRRRFPECPPVAGGSEHIWIAQYVEARHNWLQNHPNHLVMTSAYRTKDYLREINAGNWNLDKVFYANGVRVD